MQKRPLIIVIAASVGTTLIIEGAIIGSLFLFGLVGDRHNLQSSSTTGNSSGANSQISIATQRPTVPDCVTHNAIDSHTWLEIAKSPDDHMDECLTVYGEVTQFDSATGDSTFRADVGGTQEIPQYGFVNYPTNTVLTGDTVSLENVVDKDLFTANVTVLGSETYSTQIGGQTTVPKLRVDSIQVTGSLSS